MPVPMPRVIIGPAAPSGSLQEAIFNKNTGKVILKTFSLYRKLLTLSRAGHDQGEAGEGD